MAVLRTAYLRLRFLLALLLALWASTSGLSARAETTAVVVEYYNATLDHFFITADPAEIAFLDGGGLGGAWQRTGKSFEAWTASDGPTNSVQVCRFFGTDQYRADGTRIGPNSHFYTADAAECAYVRTAWQSPAGNGQTYPAWTFETYSFRVIPPTNGVCPVDKTALYRAYNNGARGNPNHRYATDLALLQSMPEWIVEGVVMCLPRGPVAAFDSADCLIPVPGRSGVLQDAAAGVTQRWAVRGTATAPVVSTTMDINADGTAGTINEERRYSVAPGSNGTRIMQFGSYSRTLSASGATITTQAVDGQVLALPMVASSSQSGASSVGGTLTIAAPGLSCFGLLTGTISWTWNYVGIETVAVPAGTFNACHFTYVRTEALVAECTGYGVGSAEDTAHLWFAPNIGLIKSGNLEMTSHSP